MPAVEERLSFVEVKMQEIGMTLVRMEGILASVHQMVLALDQRVDRLEQRVGMLDQHVGILDQHVDKLDARVEKQFLWVAGIQMTTLITIMAGLFALVAKLI
jgi:hypothetical protein